MIEERLSDDDRQHLLGLLLRQVPDNGPPPDWVMRLIAKFSGSDTVVKVERAYPSRQTS